ncbi:TonB-dependent receptor [Kangiella koreensis]|uniref:TonB-dependent receptor n=1 Tax=Kangiella koreensis (strain DSM 16069 / JCM 12317 / KCTC 12182 / SW-125) TaxID=523791 RepID=C7R6C7_KANKD|nr:hypothetical protein [Kangiella koreensis]ACV27355.1 hypothetical protein Kkor_1945 [Kangiella koreensis DSM 16069]
MIISRKSKPFRTPVVSGMVIALVASFASSNYAKEVLPGDSIMSQDLLTLSPTASPRSLGKSPFVIDDQSIRVSANDISVSLLPNNEFGVLGTSLTKSDPVSFSIKNDAQGEWLVSLDLSSSGASESPNTNISAGYDLPNQTSQFFVNYGRQTLPVSVSFENPVNSILNGKQLDASSLAFGFNQEVHDGWDVTISYLKSDFDLVTTESALAQMQDKSSSSSYRFFYDFNQDGAPEAINLMSNLSGIEGFQQNLEGIEIKISRQLSSNFALGASVEQSKGLYQQQAIDLSKQVTPFETNSYSLYGGMRFAEDWTVGANVNKQESQFAFESSPASNFKFEDTTLDIGLQYQTKWNKTGLVIRIDLMNLLGAAHLEDSLSQSMDLDARGLVPYTFQSPKYIKLSGSINF